MGGTRGNGQHAVYGEPKPHKSVFSLLVCYSEQRKCVFITQCEMYFEIICESMKLRRVMSFLKAQKYNHWLCQCDCLPFNSLTGHSILSRGVYRQKISEYGTVWLNATPRTKKQRSQRSVFRLAWNVIQDTGNRHVIKFSDSINEKHVIRGAHRINI